MAIATVMQLAGGKGGEYFAMKPSAEFASALMGKLHLCRESSRYMDLVDRCRLAYIHTFGDDRGFGDTSRITRDGDIGELAVVRVNRGPALLRGLHAIVTGNKLTWKPQASNSDVANRARTELAAATLEWLWKFKGLQQHVARWAMQGLRYSEAYSFARWNRGMGPEVAVSVDGNRIIRAGDVEPINVLPWDVFRDVAATSWEACRWVAVRTWENKYDLAALYTPTEYVGDEMLAPVDVNGQPCFESITSGSASNELSRLMIQDEQDASEDLAQVWHFFHRATPAIPQGRQSVMVGGVLLEDGPLELPCLPVVRYAPDEKDGTAYGNTSFWDTLGIQELSDSLHSAIASNQLAFAHQAVIMPEGMRESADNTNGLRIFFKPPQAENPQALQLTASPPEVFGYLNALKAEQQGVMGLNDTALGQPQQKLSGSAYALLASMSTQQNAQPQSAFVAAVGELGSVYLKTYRQYVAPDEKRAIAITGRDTGYMYRQAEFSGADFEGIDTVFVDVGDPLANTASGRMEIAAIYRDAGLLKTPEAIEQVMQTGRVEPVTHAIRDGMNLVAQENEALSRGESPPVHYYQDHLIHVRENASVLSNPEALKDVAIVHAVQQHIEAHYREFWGLPDGMDVKADPMFPVRIRIMLGQVPPELAPPPQPGGPQQEGAPQGAAPAPGTPGSPVQPPQLPQMPENPQTGQPFDHATGGGAVPPPSA